ncbi:MAG: deoxyhypusine synthase family protein, partial [Halobacteriaceae archaeon]
MSDDDGDRDRGRGHGRDQPDREEFRHDPLAHAAVWAGMSVGELVEQYGSAGVGAADLHEAADVYAEMIGRDDVTNFVGLAGAMVPTGMRQIVVDLIRDGHVDALVTTGANLTHDAIEAVGGKHHHGRPEQAGKTTREHDEQLREEEVDRIYNVYLPQEHFA